MEEPQEEVRTTPAWVMTFADLMSLLMCFFVLLLSFAEIDATRFKQIADSLEQAFGVQREVPVMEIPMGTSPVFDKFSPGTPQPTVLDEVRQTTTEQDPRLQTMNAQAVKAIQEAVQKQMDRTAAEVAASLAREIESGMLQLEKGPERLVIRVEERGSFGSGSADMTPQFREILGRMSDTLAKIPGDISIEGHTDNIPIRTARFQSNWDLSAARASSVANTLLEKGTVTPQRLRIQGHAETRPVADNDTPENRALNRRVEIMVDLSGPIDEYVTDMIDLIEAGRANELPGMSWR